MSDSSLNSREPLSHDAATLELKGVGPAVAEKLAKLGIHSVQDILFHLPLRYVDRTRVQPIGSLQPNHNVVIEGEVKAASIVLGRRRSLMVKVQDKTGIATLRFFHFSRSQQDNFRNGRKIRCFGEVRLGRAGLELYHPEYQFSGDRPLPNTETLTPIYPATDGLTQQRIRQLTESALNWLEDRDPDELVPPELIHQSAPGESLGSMLRYLHRPPADAPVEILTQGSHPFQQKLIFEELLAHQLSMQKARQTIQSRAAPALKAVDPEYESKFLKQLKFELTPAQDRVCQEILRDLEQPHPMLRLLQGDVGSGKTVVAALAALRAVVNGLQVAVMAPTEILAEQHFENFQSWFEPLQIRCIKLTGKVRGKARDTIHSMLLDGSAKVAIGTQALFQESVQFRQLGLVIIDEQHRFGVEQRLALSAKGMDGRHKHHYQTSTNSSVPHQLTMTATPIPRTLAMSHYSNLDVSVIDQLPPGRTPVTTSLISNQRRTEVVARLREQCKLGHQAYWVCTLIEESEEMECQAAEATASELAIQLPEISIGLIHGRLKPQDKTKVMDAFRRGEIDLLVATTVIEVGVDVPNASFMIIENPERLGLAQLHQLRGRVGRGRQASHCLLLYHSPLSKNGQERLAAMRRTENGFEIAEIDLRLRGPGELLGAKQAGELRFRLVDLQRDSHLLSTAHDTAKILIEHYPMNVDLLIQRWIPNGEHFAKA